MAKFPEYSEIGIVPVVSIRPQFKTLVSQFNKEGEENRKQKWLYPKWDPSVMYRNINKTDAETLWEFFIARKGMFEAFNFFMPESEGAYPSYTNEYIGTGDGSTEGFNLPCKNSLGRTVYQDGVELTEGDAYNFTAGGGADGADLIDFGDSLMSVPADGAILTMDFTGTLKVHCTFAEDYLTFEIFMDRLASTGITMRGLLNK